ncbi:MAG: hypothetical protein OXB89_03350 [Anaerolineaceae bacterium]|nr:hypothetical protein [Anaerolineaceae bacterium]
MALQPVIQGTELPGQFGELLAETPTALPGRKHKPKQMQQEISRFEKDVDESEQLVNFALAGFVEFVRQAGQDDDAARKFDEWTADLDLAQTFAAYEEKLVPGLIERAAILRKVVEGWHRMADAGLIAPDLPPQLAERVAHLDSLITNLTEEITRQHDNDLVARLLMRVGKQRQLTLEEQLRLADAVSLNWKVKEEPSVRRADWYGADGR